MGLEKIGVVSRPMPWVFDDPDAIVRVLVQGVSLFQGELEALPWAARRDLIEQLKA